MSRALNGLEFRKAAAAVNRGHVRRTKPMRWRPSNGRQWKIVVELSPFHSTYTDMGKDKLNKSLIKKLGDGVREVTGPPPDDLPDRMKELLERLKKK